MGVNNPDMTRREFQVAAVAAAASLLTFATSQGSHAAAKSSTSVARPKRTSSPTTVDHDMSMMPSGNEVVAMLMYPEMTALDFVGPQYFLSLLIGATVHHVAEDMKPVLTDTGLTIVPTISIRDCPKNVDVLFVPGGTEGTLKAMRNDVVLEFLNDRGTRAARVTSVCTGSMLLGAAGLLKGFNATSHWITRDLLALFGAKPVAQRYVQDRNRITGAGVSAGLDFGLNLLAEMRDKPYAEAAQLLAEYDPQPSLRAGNRSTPCRRFASYRLAEPSERRRKSSWRRRRFSATSSCGVM
jgi:cyclohexyl-isocyanide hydratase